MGRRGARRAPYALAAVTLAAAGLFAASGSAQAAGCGVNGSGTLWCDNRGGAELRDRPAYSAPVTKVVDRLRTTHSWFKCWHGGQHHSGGNDTWYYTQGDDKGRWGWVSADNLSTSSAFDKNPSAHGLPECPDPWD
ncbi:hypothetical protein P8605_22950 [Streptomyces sp. T-3]|nr:hypothetical protein [Streptomyces sp. T-3]